MSRAEQAARLKLAKQARQLERAAPSSTPKAAPVPAAAPDPTPISRPEVLDSMFAPRRTFDPGEHSVLEVLAYLDENPHDLERILEAETAGKSRKSILSRGE